MAQPPISRIDPAAPANANREQVAISVRGLVSRFGPRTVHNELDLDVRKGEILAIVGPSGEGKSVLMRAMAGLQPRQGGQVLTLGIDPLTHDRRQRRALARRWGVMFQDGALFSNLSVRDNIAFPMREHFHLPEALVRELCDQKLRLVGLPADAAIKTPAELSGGMRKRAALARALACDPQLLFLDEPTAGLDPVAAARFDALVRELADAMGLTVVLVTHDLDTLVAVPDRIAVLLNGKVAALGPLESVRDNATGWIAEYFAGPRGRASHQKRDA